MVLGEDGDDGETMLIRELKNAAGYKYMMYVEHQSLVGLSQ